MPQAEIEAARALRQIADTLERLVRVAGELQVAIRDASERIETALYEISKVLPEERHD